MLAIFNAVIVAENYYISEGTILIENDRILDFGRKLLCLYDI